MSIRMVFSKMPAKRDGNRNAAYLSAPLDRKE